MAFQPLVRLTKALANSYLDADHIGALANTRLTKPQAKALVKRLTESYQIPVSGYGNLGIDPDSDSYLYRNLTMSMRTMLDRKLTEQEQERLQKIGHYLWQVNPLCQQAVGLIVNYCINSGFAVVSKNEKVQEVLDEHWNDPDNNWDDAQKDCLRDMIIFGELAMPTAIAEQSGHTKVGHLDPYLIKQVTTNPANISQPWALVLKSPAGAQEIKPLEIVRWQEGKLQGECLYFALNKLRSSSRGFSPLLSIVDYLDAYDKFMFSVAENQAVADEFMYDISVEGANDEELKELNQNIDKSKGSGKYRIHNDRQKWQLLSPSLNASDKEGVAKLIMGMILAGSGLPIHWLIGQGETLNRASALSMGDPTMMQLLAMQQFWARCIKKIFGYHLYNVKARSNRLSNVPDNELTFDVVTPPINVKNDAEESTTLKTDTDSLMTAEQSRWIKKETAAKLWASRAEKRFGQEVEIDEEGIRQDDELEKY